MKLFVVFVFASLAFASASAERAEELRCLGKSADVPTDWIDMVDPCYQGMRNQIQEELRASIQYLAMAAHFSRDTVNKPGFADLFFTAASEEREHAIKLIEYLLMRGKLTDDVRDLIKRRIVPAKMEWKTGSEAIKDALKLEATVTRKIRDVVAVCEDPKDSTNFNDYHLVDYLTGEFLEEQYKGQRELAGRASTLDKMLEQHGALGEFLFDKKLLAGEV